MKITVFLCSYFFSGYLWASEFSTEIQNINIELIADQYQLNAKIKYKLSPIAKEALQKGIVLTWYFLISVEERGVLWNSTLRRLIVGYQIQNHELLNLFSVKRLDSGEKLVFSTLAAAVNFISGIQGVSILDKQSIQSGKQYQVAVKIEFEHEALPISLRPFSYFDRQWALSSHWTIWPFQN